jgi:type IV pilus assembly protein PilY1
MRKLIPRHRACVLVAAVMALAALSDAEAADQVVSLAASSSKLDRSPIVFAASFSADAWTGTVTARTLSAAGAATPMWDAARKLDTRSDADLSSERFVLTTGPTGVAIPFRWSAMTPAERDVLGAQGLNEAKLDFLRGDRRQEAGNAGTLRSRKSRVGDIVNSNPWFVASRPLTASGPPPRPAMVYVGANDGMLHGFAADDGAEKLAYVPRGVQARLSLLARTDYAHQFYVDGPVFAGEASTAAAAPRTFLVASLGSGGKGFFVLDVTDPTQFSNGNPGQILHTDRTGDSDADIGQISAPPAVDAADANRSRQIVRMNNGRWAAVMGNGYFSANEAPVLLIQYLDDQNRDLATGARELQKISPCAGAGPCAYRGGNGLATPQLIDVNGDGKVDLAYAGDLQGNVWKFDLSAANDESDATTAWKMSFDNKPFFIARGADGKRQAITTAPHWMPHPRGGIMIAVGTGRNLDDKDRSTKSIDTIYGLHDDSGITLDKGKVTIKDTLPIHRAEDASPRSSALVTQAFLDTFQDAGVTYRNSTSRAVDYAGPDRKRGWLLDLPVPGQRVLHNPSGYEGQRFIVQSTIPVPGSNVAPRSTGASTISVLNMLTGQPPAQQVFMLSDPGLAPAGLSMVSQPPGPTLQFRLPGQTQLRGADQPGIGLRSSNPAGVRAGWREVR